jgi:hypothetical protein
VFSDNTLRWAAHSHQTCADAEEDSLGQYELVVLDAQRSHHETDRQQHGAQQNQTLGAIGIKKSADEQSLRQTSVCVKLRETRRPRTEKKNVQSCKEPIHEISDALYVAS